MRDGLGEALAQKSGVLLVEDRVVSLGSGCGERGPAVVRTLTLHRPGRRNALDTALITELIRALEAAERDTRVRAVVLAGEGRVFCAGGDVKEFADAPDPRDRMVGRARLLTRLLTLLPAMTTPIVAAVVGAAIGAGAALALAADVIVAGDDVVVGYPEIKDSVVPAGVMPSAIRALGQKLAFEMLTQARQLDASELSALRLVSRVVAPGEAIPAAVETAEVWARLDPAALMEAKRLFYRVSELPIEAGFRAGLDVTAATWRPRR
ncbi:enoyl-CoA hydratase/isomerase family protein [Amycolatopsis rubida]|uniref:Enoyl-CoA hydratase/isomerase family protein n=1 Tax=Amycolatopsis rubida TaxID=112413 RepID=A0ABX0C1U6_9PSEU|nr:MULTISPECIES: enoyl-CoA hydratase/isomerase family protein [Amycolatopsis]MYW96142.1 enoyl-CoA hydratase/isomerase family protein [Amycolatopsis rubida]NEC61133.1 enoyl-CoA hydratase/isomerase family protein [Amycolatopsis rubida]OAP23344.1 2,3-dehydroadipyl-CoA hydratase [Amycolatopsis sp. M39]